MKLIYSIRRGIEPVFLSFLIAAFFIGIASALQFPTLSRFLTNEVATPGLMRGLADLIHPKQFWVGLFFSVSAIVSMLVSFMLARRSDRMTNRKGLIVFCCVMALANTLLFALSRNYFLLISLGVLFYALASCITPQLFALAREYMDYSARDAAMFSSVMRAQLSLAWVIGPPLSFMLSSRFGFTIMYLSAAAIFVFGGVLIYLFLPSVPRVALPSEQQHDKGAFLKDRNVVMLFISMVLMWTCNMMYLIDMPIYTDKTLGLSQDLAGYLMGMAAGLEIPFMILSGYYVRKFGKRRMMIGAVFAGAFFYAGLALFQSQAMLILLQIFNAIFIGIIAGIGMLYFQDLLPGRAGEATTLFSNSATMGIILAGVLQGGFAGSLGHQSVYYLASVLIVIALALCWRVRDA